MNELRIILILVGAIILIGVYLLGRRHSFAREKSRQENLISVSNNDGFSDSVKTLSENQRREKKWTDLEITSSQHLSEDLVEEFREDIDWDNIDDMDLEWLAESMDNTNYDQLLYQLGDGVAEQKVGQMGLGYGYPPSSEKSFVALKKTDNEKVRLAVNNTQNLETLVLVIHILAKNGAHINGSRLQNALSVAGMQYGENHCFHYYADPELTSDVQHKQQVFSLVNAVEPCMFDHKTLSTLLTPGVTLMLQFPCPIDGSIAFEKFYQTAKLLATKLDGVLFDASRNRLTKQCLNDMKDQVTELSRNLQLSYRSSIH